MNGPSWKRWETWAALLLVITQTAMHVELIPATGTMHKVGQLVVGVVGALGLTVGRPLVDTSGKGPSSGAQAALLALALSLAGVSFAPPPSPASLPSFPSPVVLTGGAP